MRNRKLHYFNAYKFSHRLLLIVICVSLLACNRQNSAKQFLLVENVSSVSAAVINVNTASISELEKLPHIGRRTAQEIVEHRELFGKFRKPEHLLLIRGISDKKFREIKNLIVAE